MSEKLYRRVTDREALISGSGFVPVEPFDIVHVFGTDPGEHEMNKMFREWGPGRYMIVRLDDE